MLIRDCEIIHGMIGDEIILPYRVIIQTEDKKGLKKEEWNKSEDTIDDCLDVLKDWIPNVIRRKNIVNIQIIKEE